MPVKRVSAMSQLLKEQAEQQNATVSPEEEAATTRSAMIEHAQVQTAPGSPASVVDKLTRIPRSGKTALQQGSDTAILQSANTVLPQTPPPATRERKTDSRDKMTFYLDAGQRDKLDDLRRAYRQQTGTRLNEQDFMRLVVARLELGMLLPE